MKKIKHIIKKIFFSIKPDEEYWYTKYLKTLNVHKYKGSYNPKISIITPVYNVERSHFVDMVESVLQQTYHNWELCLVDDCSTKKYIKPLLEKYAKKDARIKVKFLEKNKHIAGASNEALQMSTGEYIAFLDNDDMLFENALAECIKILEKKPKTNLIYSDNILINEKNKITGTSFKPSWSPEFYLSTSYLIHFCIFSKETIEKVGLFNEGPEYRGVQDIDIKLKVMNIENYQVEHINKPLYKWRVIASSVSQAASNKDYVIENSLRVYNDYLKRKKLNYTYEYPREIAKYDVGAFKINFSSFNRNLKIAILTKYDECINYEKIYNAFEKHGYANLSFYIYDTKNNVQYKQTSSYSSLNEAIISIEKDKSNYIVSVVDLTNLTKESLDEILGPLTLDDKIMVCGGRIIHQNRLIRGAYLFTNQIHIKNYGIDISEPGWWFNNLIMHNVSAVSGYFMGFKKETLEFLKLSSDFYDLEDIRFCISLINNKYRVVYNPWAILNVSYDLTLEKLANFKIYDFNETYYNSNFSQTRLYALPIVSSNRTVSHKIINKILNRFDDGTLLRGQDGKIYL
jgi:glycosyltransferase involved in cell wall biosynthesis